MFQGCGCLLFVYFLNTRKDACIDSIESSGRVVALSPVPLFSCAGRRAARFARGRKKKGLVHTVCACVKKRWNSETSWTFSDIFVIINGWR